MVVRPFPNPSIYATDSIATQDIRLSLRALRRERAYFEKVRRADIYYGVQLRKIAKHIGDIIKALTPAGPSIIPTLVETLVRYSHIITPWANHAATAMLAEVNKREKQAWMKTSRVIGTELKREIEQAPIGQLMQELLGEQVNLITSLPIQASEQVQLKAKQQMQEAARQTIYTGARYDTSLIKEIMDIGNVTASRATLIAVTEVAKAHAALTEVRAKYVGATHYIWRTANDYRVREMHKKLANSVQSWDDPPIAELSGERHHPGMFPRCRCFAEPILPTKFI